MEQEVCTETDVERCREEDYTEQEEREEEQCRQVVEPHCTNTTVREEAGECELLPCPACPATLNTTCYENTSKQECEYTTQIARKCFRSYEVSYQGVGLLGFLLILAD